MSNSAITANSEIDVENENIANENVVLDKLPQAALIAAIVAFVGNLIILNIGRAFGAGFEVMMPGTTALQALPIWPTLILVSVAAAAAGAIALMLLANNDSVTKPITVFGIVGLVIFLLSLYGPYNSATDGSSTVTGLMIMHGWTALTVVGMISTVARQTTDESA